MNNKKTEVEAVNIVIKQINKCDILFAEITTNDKTPSWDGDIYVYKDGNHSKSNMLGTVPVQVKGHIESALNKDSINYQIEISDLNNYKNDKGVMYFVVYFDNDKYEHYKIYYTSLVPCDIIEILGKCNENCQTKVVELVAFPEDNIAYIKSKCINFINDSRKQVSMISVKLNSSSLTNEELKNIEYFNITFMAPAENPKEYIFKEKHRIYCVQKKLSLDIPMEQVQITALKKNIKGSVYVDSEKFYENFSIEHELNKASILIGNSIKIEHNVNIDDLTYQMHYEELGGLDERIKTIKFILKLKETKKMFLGEIGINLDTLEIAEEHIKNIQERLNFLEMIKKVLQYYKVNKEIVFTDFSEKSINTVYELYTIIKNGNEINYEHNTILPPLHIKYISNIGIPLVNLTKDQKKYRIFNFFDIPKDYEFNIKNENGEQVQASRFLLLKYNHYEKISNIDYEILEQDLIGVPYSKIYAEMLNMELLNIILAYDKNNEKKLLILALKVSEYLIDNDKDQESYTTNILNHLQIIFRQRKLNDKEIEILRNIRQNNKDNVVLLAVSILYNSKEDAIYYFNLISEEQKIEFQKYPINNLRKKLLEA